MALHTKLEVSGEGFDYGGMYDFVTLNMERVYEAVAREESSIMLALKEDESFVVYCLEASQMQKCLSLVLCFFIQNKFGGKVVWNERQDLGEGGLGWNEVMDRQNEAGVYTLYQYSRHQMLFEKLEHVYSVMMIEGGKFMGLNDGLKKKDGRGKGKRKGVMGVGKGPDSERGRLGTRPLCQYCGDEILNPGGVRMRGVCSECYHLIDLMKKNEKRLGLILNDFFFQK